MHDYVLESKSKFFIEYLMLSYTASGYWVCREKYYVKLVNFLKMEFSTLFLPFFFRKLQVLGMKIKVKGEFITISKIIRGTSKQK